MRLFLISNLIDSVPSKIRNIFLGTTLVSLSKASFSFLILYLLANTSEGTITQYGNLQNMMTILISIFGLSVQNGISTYTARAYNAGQNGSISSQIVAVGLVGLSIFISFTIFAYVSGLGSYTFFGYTVEGGFEFYSLMILGLLGAIQLTYSAILVGLGYVVKAQALELIRVMTIAVCIVIAIYFSLELNLFIILLAGYALISVILLRAMLSVPNFNWRPKFDLRTYEIFKTGVVTAYIGVLLASVMVFVRNTAVDYGSYQLSDTWEILIRVIAIYQLVVALPLGQILLRTYATADPSKTRSVFQRALPLLIVPVVIVFVLPESFFSVLFKLVFNKEIQNIKLICCVLVLAETFRALGITFHNFLVSRAKIVPQIVFETMNQCIVVGVVLYFSSVENFILHYFLGYLVANISWFICNFLYLKFFYLHDNKDSEHSSNSF